MINIEEYIQNQLEGIEIEHLVSDEIRRHITDDIKRQISKVVREHIDEIIKTEINIVMESPIQTNDGWGKKEKYSTFRDLFKKEFREKMNSSWDMKTLIQKIVQNKVNELFQNNFKEVAQKIADTLAKQAGCKEQA